MKKLILYSLAVLCTLLLVSPIYAQTGVGKISGKILDANTKEPLIGANVVVLNTNLGAASNIDGEYFILNVTPGTYEVKFIYVGYAAKTFQDVRIVANITFELNAELSTDFTLETLWSSKKNSLRRKPQTPSK